MVSVFRCITPVVLALELTCAVVAAQPRRAPLPLAESLRVMELGNRFRMSPDGQRVAFTTRDTSRRRLFAGAYSNSGLEGQEVWIVNAAGGVPLRLDGGSNWSPVWSPDSRALAFISDRDGGNHLWLWDRATGRSRRVSTVPLRQYGNAAQFRSWSYLQWTPDGREVLAKVVPEGMTETDVEAFVQQPSGDAVRRALGDSAVTELRADEIGTGASARTAQANARQKVLFGDLALINVATGAVRRLAQRVQASRYDLSPDGTAVVFLDAKGLSGYKAAWSYDLVVVDLRTGDKYEVARDVLQHVVGMQLKWSADSRWIAYVDGTADGGHVRIVSRGERQHVDLLPVPAGAYYSDQVLPVWDAAGEWLYIAGPHSVQRVRGSGRDRETLVTVSEDERITQVLTAQDHGGHLWSGDGRSLVLEIENRDSHSRTLARLDLATRHRTNLPAAAEDAGHSVASQQAHLTGESVLYAFESATRIGDLWIATPDGTRRPVSRTNPVFEDYVLGEPRLVEWRNSDGVKRRGALLLPAGYEVGRRYPLLVSVYGSALQSQAIGTFGLGGPLNNMQLFTTRGYAVLFPDSNVRVGTPMADIAKNVLPGVDRVIELGIADPDRIGVLGHSYGGYSALALITQTTRFKAAVSYAGLANLLSAYGLMDDNGTAEQAVVAEEGQVSMGGSPWEYRERYIENSPQVFLDRVQTPVLLVCGDQDNLWSQSDEVFIGLRRLGKTVTYAKYAGVGHTIVYYPALVDHWERLIAWFDRYLLEQPSGNTRR